jgi:poly(hydroxyalkanoate) depolymerase family esterase
VTQNKEESVPMSNPMQDGMAEATRLTREGRLAEATAVIQRALGGRFAPDNAGDPARRTAKEASHPTAPSRPEEAAERAPRRSRCHRSLQRPPAGVPGTGAGVLPAPAQSSQFIARSYTNRAGTRAYKLYIPSGYVGQAVPLIVMLHGCTQNPDDFAAGTHMNKLAEEHTFLVAYPAQSRNANTSKCWNWFKTDDQRRGRGEPSIIAGITREVCGEYSVAGGRVYVAGMSAGGAMAAIMGATYPDLYAAVGVHSGLAPGVAQDLPSAFSAMQHGGAAAQRDSSTGDFARTVPVIVFHGDRDTTVHPRNADDLLAHYEPAASETTPPATVRQGQVPDGYAYTRTTHHRHTMERWIVHGLGHAWSGGSRSGSHTDPKGPDASAEMVRFFNQHQQREPVDRPTD